MTNNILIERVTCNQLRNLPGYKGKGPIKLKKQGYMINGLNMYPVVLFYGLKYAES